MWRSRCSLSAEVQRQTRHILNKRSLIGHLQPIIHEHRHTESSGIVTTCTRAERYRRHCAYSNHLAELDSILYLWIRYLRYEHTMSEFRVWYEQVSRDGLRG